MSWRLFGADYFDCNNNKMVDTVLKIGLLHRQIDKCGKAECPIMLFVLTCTVLFYNFKPSLFNGLSLKSFQIKTYKLCISLQSAGHCIIYSRSTLANKILTDGSSIVPWSYPFWGEKANKH